MNAPEKFLAGTAAQPATGTSHPHESARAQVAGAATYVDDVPEVRGTLHGAPVLSNVARGKLRAVHTADALAMPGVKAVLLARDVPGDPILATFTHDEPIFALDTVEFVGQVVALVVADTVMQARRAARKVKLEIEPLPAILDVREAVKAQSFVLPPVTVRRGDPEQGLASAPMREKDARYSKDVVDRFPQPAPGRSAGAVGIVRVEAHGVWHLARLLDDTRKRRKPRGSRGFHTVRPEGFEPPAY